MFSNGFVYFDFAFSRHDLWSIAKGTPQDVQGGIEIAIDELIVSVGGTAPQQASHGRFRPFAPPFLYFLKHGVWTCYFVEVTIIYLSKYNYACLSVI